MKKIRSDIHSILHWNRYAFVLMGWLYALSVCGATVSVDTETALASAIANAKAKDIIQLSTDISLAACCSIESDKDVTLDLNNHTLSRSSAAVGLFSLIMNSGTLTIKNGTLSGGQAAIGGGILNYGHLTLGDGLVVEGNASTSNYAGGVYSRLSSSVTLTLSGKVIVIGNTSNGIDANVCVQKDASTPSLILADDLAANSNIGITLVNNESGTLSITEGDFATWTKGEVSAADLITRFTPDNVGQGVKQGSGSTLQLLSEAKIGDVTYPTMDAAIAAVKDGDTIRVLHDMTLSSPLEASRNATYTIDFNNTTLTNSLTTAIDIQTGAVTLRNGTISAVSAHAITVQNGAKAYMKTNLKVNVSSATHTCLWVANGGYANVFSGYYTNTSYTTLDFAKTVDKESGGALTLYGGYYKGEKPTSYVADKYEILDSGENGWYVYLSIENRNIRISGSNYYPTLQAAVDAAENGQTLVVLNDISLSNPVSIAKRLTLTLSSEKNCTITAGCAEAIQVTNGGQLTITPYEEYRIVLAGPTGSAAATFDGKALVVVDGAKAYLTIEDASVTIGGNENKGMCGIEVRNDGHLVIGKSGDSHTPSISSYLAAVKGNETSKANITIYKGSLTATNSCAALLANSPGQLSVYGGSIYGLSAPYKNIDLTIDIYGGYVYGETDSSSSVIIADGVTGSVSGTRSVTITGGYYARPVESCDTKFISGGCFTQAPSASYVTTGYQVIDKGSETTYRYQVDRTSGSVFWYDGTDEWEVFSVGASETKISKLPEKGNPACSTKFVEFEGWYEGTFTKTTAKPNDIFTTVGDAPEFSSQGSGASYYAVWKFVSSSQGTLYSTSKTEIKEIATAEEQLQHSVTLDETLQAGEVFDFLGRRMDALQPGHIYIVNGQVRILSHPSISKH